MFTSTFLSIVLFMLAPGCFPGVAKLRGRRSEVLTYFGPLGGLFAFSLFASNLAYIYCSVPMLQFMKELGGVTKLKPCLKHIEFSRF